MRLTTTIPIEPITPAINYNSMMVFMGSCFTENIGYKMSYYGFKNLINPFGIIFNPYSIRLLIERSLNGTPFTDADVEDSFSYLAHSGLNGDNPQEVLEHLNNAASLLKKQMSTASHIFITLGTAWVYEHINQQRIVANCHKQPQHLFEKKLLSIKQITNNLNHIINQIHSVQPHAQIIFTLSPVRHLKDGFVENRRSKSRLFEAIQDVIHHTNTHYFPAYEMVMDELRDYRFYDRDMLHLNEVGIEFVWLRFRESVINKSSYTTMTAVEKYRKLVDHHPTDKETHAQQVKNSKQKLLEQFPNIHL